MADRGWWTPVESADGRPLMRERGWATVDGWGVMVDVRGGQAPRITLYSRPGCHLCETARDVVAAVATETGVGWCEQSIDGDPALRSAYGEQIPVVLVDGRVHDYWRVDADRLRAALTAR